MIKIYSHPLISKEEAAAAETGNSDASPRS
jgi:hypothetical protein